MFHCNIDAGSDRPTRKLSCIAQDKERPGKPEDVVRLYDGMAAFAADLGDLANAVGGAAGEALIDRASAQVRADLMRDPSLDCRAESVHSHCLHRPPTMLAWTDTQVAQFEAARCFYTALSFTAGEQHEQAYCLMDRAVQRTEAALRKWKVQIVLYGFNLAPLVAFDMRQVTLLVLLIVASLPQDCDDPDAAALEELARLRSAAMAHRCAAHACVLAEAGRLNKGIASLDIAAAGQTAGDVREAWLLTSTDAWQSFATDGSPQVAPIPPSLQSIPARPILLDAAQDHVVYKSLVHRAEQRPETKSTFSRLFTGWGR